jgi:hypothetical protein
MPRLFPCAALPALVLGCTVYNTPEVTELPRPRASDSVAVLSYVKAHLLDGSTVVYRGGLVIVRDTVRSAVINAAYRYGLTLADSAPADALPLDSILGMESFQSSVNGFATFTATVSAIAGTSVVVGLAAIAIFGSCPTFYSDSSGTPVLEAEGFSYSIAPLFEDRDVDRLRAQPGPAGELRLEVRNEALETHYINQLGLLDVHHARDELVVPDNMGRPLAIRRLVTPATARNRSGRDVLAELVGSRGFAFSTDSETIGRATPEDPNDYLDLAFAAPAGSDTVALVFRMRNSLLNTVLLYEEMLAAPGARALDWMGRELEDIGPAGRLGRWYAGHMGMRVALRDGIGLREVARIPDTGPIAWKDVAVLVPVPPGDSLRLRLTFLADDWRIERVQLALDARRAVARALEPVALLDGDGRADTAALASVRAADERYLVTSPGQRFEVRFAAGPAPADSARTALVVSEGYYMEWLRASWLKGVHRPVTFQPSDTVLVEVLHRWLGERADFERRFAATRLPVR